MKRGLKKLALSYALNSQIKILSNQFSALLTGNIDSLTDKIDAFNVIVDDDNAGTVVIKFSKYF